MKTSLLCWTVSSLLCALPAHALMDNRGYIADMVDLTTIITPEQQMEANERFIHMILDAKKSIRVCAYGFTNPHVATALIQAHERGVDVKIIMDKTQAGGKNQKVLVKRMQDAGIPMQIGRSPVRSQIIHAKYIVVDETLVEDGSWNFTTNASYQVNTLNFTNSPERAKQFLDSWNNLWQYLLTKSKKKASRISGFDDAMVY